MVRFDEYYYFDANEIAFVRKTTASGAEHPYRIFVGIKGGQEYGVNYANEKARNDAYNRLVRDIEQERRQPIEQLRWKLEMINITLKTLDKRQMKIWRQLKELLGLKVEDK